MIRPCTPNDFDTILAIINDAARAYRGVIPADCYHEPYMSDEHLRHEIDAGVVFWGYDEAGETSVLECGAGTMRSMVAPLSDSHSAMLGDVVDPRMTAPPSGTSSVAQKAAMNRRTPEIQQGELVGVMGIQDVKDVTLIRHAYVRTDRRQHGIGTQLLRHLLAKTSRPILIGTWADAGWAIRFYEKHGFHLVSPDEKDRLLKRYWTISERQIETSVVLKEKSIPV